MERPKIVADDEEKPLDPAAEKVRRKLVRFVAINLGILFAAVMAVLAAVVYKVSTPSSTDAPAGAAAVPSPSEEAFAEGEIALPSGARIVSQSLSGNRLAIEAELSGGGRAIFLYDTVERRMVGRYAVRFQ